MTKKIPIDEYPELVEELRDLFDGATIDGTNIKEITVEGDLATVKAQLSVYGRRSAWWLDSTLRLRLREGPEAEKERLVSEGLSDLAEGKIQRAGLSEILNKLTALEAKVRALGTEKADAYDSANPGWKGELSSLAATIREIVEAEESQEHDRAVQTMRKETAGIIKAAGVEGVIETALKGEKDND